MLSHNIDFFCGKYLPFCKKIFCYKLIIIKDIIINIAIAYNMKIYLRFFNFIFLLSPNLAKHPSRWLVIEQHHKIGKKKKKKTQLLCNGNYKVNHQGFVFQFCDVVESTIIHKMIWLNLAINYIWK